MTTHMRRSVEAFERAGLGPVAAPTVVLGKALPVASVRAWVPTAQSLVVTVAVVHEYLGRLWYWLRARP